MKALGLFLGKNVTVYTKDGTSCGTLRGIIGGEEGVAFLELSPTKLKAIPIPNIRGVTHDFSR